MAFKGTFCDEHVLFIKNCDEQGSHIMKQKNDYSSNNAQCETLSTQLEAVRHNSDIKSKSCTGYQTKSKDKSRNK